MIVKSALKLARKKKKNRTGQVSPLLLGMQKPGKSDVTP